MLSSGNEMFTFSAENREEHTTPFNSTAGRSTRLAIMSDPDLWAFIHENECTDVNYKQYHKDHSGIIPALDPS